MTPDKLTQSQSVKDSSIVADQTLSFQDLGLGPFVLKGIVAAGFESPSPIQQEAIPLVLAGEDLIAQAQTGSGKTAAFVLPALHKMKFDKSVETLVLVPTRELAQQVADEFTRLGHFLKAHVTCVIGGQSSLRQIEQINRFGQIVVATPGRMLDHLQSGRLKRFTPSLIVLDEADEMLDMGFIEDIRKIFGLLPDERQTMMFSATMPAPIRRLAQEELHEPKFVRLVSAEAKHADIQQILYVMQEHEREDALVRLIDFENPEKAIVFCRTKKETDALSERLLQRGVQARAIHGDLTQPARLDAMKALRRGTVRILIATDVASRGLDISDLTHVFNFHVPDNKERYTHRIGRTGRAGNKGLAITLATPREILSHDFFHGNRLEDFTLASVPARNELDNAHQERLIHSVQETEITAHAKGLCARILAQHDAEEFLLRFLSYMQPNEGAEGPDRLGLHPDEVRSLRNRRAARRESSGRGARSGGRFRGKRGSYGSHKVEIQRKKPSGNRQTPRSR